MIYFVAGRFKTDTSNQYYWESGYTDEEQGANSHQCRAAVSHIILNILRPWHLHASLLLLSFGKTKLINTIFLKVFKAS